MAYEYKKLSEVEAIDVADSSVNLIVETEDEIKKLNIGDLPIGGQEQADWDEEDATKPSFIKNKPDLSQVGGSGGEVVFITVDWNGSITSYEYEDGTPITPSSLKEKFETGAKVYVSIYESGVYMDDVGYGYGVAYLNSFVHNYQYIPAHTQSGSQVSERIILGYYNRSTYRSLTISG